ncbi:uncharacterized protein [Penaeus vannamei]|uniref:uncharacterized protein n=1 Tax=Penaeus vannamei TaxID=6689 RepID=UPI00387F422E
MAVQETRPSNIKDLLETLKKLAVHTDVSYSVIPAESMPMSTGYSDLRGSYEDSNESNINIGDDGDSNGDKNNDLDQGRATLPSHPGYEVRLLSNQNSADCLIIAQTKLHSGYYYLGMTTRSSPAITSQETADQWQEARSCRGTVPSPLTPTSSSSFKHRISTRASREKRTKISGIVLFNFGLVSSDPSDAIVSSDPSDAIVSSDPSDAIVSSEPSDAIVSSEPSDAIVSSDPSDAIVSSDPSDAIVSSDPSDAIVSSDPSDAIVSSDPSDAIVSSDPSDAIVSSDPSDAIVSSDPSDAIVSSDPSDAIVSSDPSDAIVSSEPSDAIVSSEPSDAIVSSDPSDAIVSSDPSDAIVSSDPSDAICLFYI